MTAYVTCPWRTKRPSWVGGGLSASGRKVIVRSPPGPDFRSGCQASGVRHGNGGRSCAEARGRKPPLKHGVDEAPPPPCTSPRPAWLGRGTRLPLVGERGMRAVGLHEGARAVAAARSEAVAQKPSQWSCGSGRVRPKCATRSWTWAGLRWRGLRLRSSR